MKYGVVGSRRYADLDRVDEWCCAHITPEDTIVSGGAVGVDTIARLCAMAIGCKYVEFKPDYKKYGRYLAPKLRNTLIVKESDVIVAFWDGKSGGTWDSMQKALEMGKEVITP